MESLYAEIGRRQLRIEAQDVEYEKLLQLLAGVLTGEIARSRVLVNLTDRNWACVPAGEMPAMPGTINGLPVCVTGKPETNDGTP
jgi:hypothetical protein